MRILLTSHYALPHLGGIEVVVDRLARELVTRGHEVTHLTSAVGLGGESGTPQRPYRVVAIPAVNGLERRLGVPWPLFSPALAPAARREVARADVVHAHGFLYLSSALALLGAPGGRRPVRVLTEHVGRVRYAHPLLDAVQTAAIATLGRATTHAADAVVVFNATVRRAVEALVPGTPVVWIPNGVDTDRFRPATPEERGRLRSELGWDDRPRALFVGRLVAKKGIALAVAAAARAGVELAVVGPGTLAHPPPNVTVLGPQPPARVAELLRAADMFVLPSRGEGFPLSVQEALASGLAVVVLEDPGYAPYLRDAGPALRAAPPTIEGVASELRELAADPGTRAAAGRHAAAYARAAFAWSRAVDEHERLYERLAAAT